MVPRPRVTEFLFSCLALLAVLTCVVSAVHNNEPPAAIPGSRHTTTEAAAAFRAALDCSARGKWVYNPTPRILPWMRKPWNGLQVCDQARYYSKVGMAGPQADTEAITHGNWSVRESLKWDWVVEEPDTCLWEEFNRAEFCRILGPGRSIVILGDSMSLGFFFSLWNNMLVNATNIPSPLFPDGCAHLTVPEDASMICEGGGICSEEFPHNPVQLRFLRNSALRLNRTPQQTMAPFVLDIEAWNPDVIVINRGAWYAKSTVWEKGVRIASKWLREKFPHALIIYRDTPPGHKDCTNYTAPLSTRQDPKSIPLPFNWGDFAPQNKIARSLIAEYGGIYMDVDTMTALRPDGHMNHPSWPVPNPDCLHYCLPGPLDQWVRKLQNILKLALPPPKEKPVWVPREEGVGGRKGGVGRGAMEGISGSKVKSKEAAEKVREQLDCFSKNGAWRGLPSPVLLPWPRPPYGGLSHCDRAHVAQKGRLAGEDADAEARVGGKNEAWTVRDALKHRWEVGKGECGGGGGWLPFDGSDFCRVLKEGRKVLLVGDSLNLQFTKSLLYSTIMNSSGDSLKNLEDKEFAEQCASWHTPTSHRQLCYTQHICTGEFQDRPVTLRFVQNRILSLTQQAREEEAPWMDVVKQWKPSVIVLNRGMHFVALPRFLEELEETMQGLRATAPDALVIYRNTPMGHVRCVNDSTLRRNVQDFNTMEWGDHWTDMEGQNYMARDVIESYGAVYMDVATMTNLRADGHMGLRGHGKESESDCVHYCEPGPIDTWVRVLYNILLRTL